MESTIRSPREFVFDGPDCRGHPSRLVSRSTRNDRPLLAFSASRDTGRDFCRSGAFRSPGRSAGDRLIRSPPVSRSPPGRPLLDAARCARSEPMTRGARVAGRVKETNALVVRCSRRWASNSRVTSKVSFTSVRYEACESQTPVYRWRWRRCRSVESFARWSLRAAFPPMRT